MRRKSNVMTPEQHQARLKRQERIAASTDAALTAFCDAIERGEPPEAASAAMRAAAEQTMPASRRAPPILEPDAMLRISDDGWTADKQRGFLIHLAETGCVSHACAHVGLSRQSAYALRRRAPNSVFAIGWDVAIHMARQALLDEATERAFQGREVPVWYHGEQVGKRIVHNDRLLIFLLGQRREPLHPALDARELTHLFPAMLRVVDTILPPAFSAERIAELTGEDDFG
ncbi:hypothetical protein [Sphingomonas sp. dw_22]|uniref:hypothetical protein n=1 Tax=Sphingomonas sp. dw_22 TaxID=2721175 RepID=UPI001BD4EC4A|nr:hypothetical protein [Sphingomonas sp. dw_22]